MERSLRILAALLMLALVVGAAFVFFRSQVLKSAPSPIIAPTVSSATFSPNAFRPARRAATLTVGLRKADRATVVIFDTDDRQIAEAATTQKGRKLRASWNGRLPSGTLAPDGPYRFAIRLLRQDRTIRIPDPIILDTTAPVVASDAKPGQRIAPGLEGSMGAYSFTLSADEPVKFRLDVRQIQPNGADRLVRRETDLQFARRKEMRWAADAGNLPLDKVGTPVGPGSYIVGWKAEDRAGKRRARGGADDRGLGDRRVDEPVFAVARMELRIRAENAVLVVADTGRAAGAAGDVLAHDDDPLVAVHLDHQGFGERLTIGLDSHVMCSSPSS